IALHLSPPDVLALASSNKFFRNIFMSSSSKHIWTSAITNIDGMSECPVGLAEPKYSDLISMFLAQECGARVLRRMDACLRVRLCASCHKSL
ncbi:hypothetical protein B0J17DRAFT_583083, partial [Rhizoctonia solani]